MKRTGSVGKRTLYVAAAALMFMTVLAGTARAQSDPDQAIPISNGLIEGEGDGQAAVYYYSFVAKKGEVKITVDASAKPYSTLLDVELMDEDGKQLEMMSVVANEAGKREVRRHKFLQQMRALIKVRMRDDKDVKSLVYKIKVEGDAAFTGKDSPSASISNEGTNTADATAQSSASNTPPAESQPNTDGAVSAPTSADESNTGQSTQNALKQKAKEKAKGAATKAASKVLDKFPF